MREADCVRISLEPEVPFIATFFPQPKEQNKQTITKQAHKIIWAYGGDYKLQFGWDPAHNVLKEFESRLFAAIVVDCSGRDVECVGGSLVGGVLVAFLARPVTVPSRSFAVRRSV